VLAVRDLDLFYGDAQALDSVSVTVASGEIVVIIGANGAGKSSLIRAVFGMEKPKGGSIRFEEREIRGLPSHVICNLGIGQVAEGRQIFPNLTVRENLEMGAVLPRARAGAAAAMNRVLALFPRLAERRRQAAGTLSGGEQQMLAIARALMSRPKLVLFDEPSLGLAPNLVERTFEIIRSIRARGVTVVLVEQNAFAALELSDRSYVLEQGRVTLAGSGAELLDNPHVRSAYLGG
jgi:branched-chain amino acid transport system ATP-binding protein